MEYISAFPAERLTLKELKQILTLKQKKIIENSEFDYIDVLVEIGFVIYVCNDYNAMINIDKIIRKMKRGNKTLTQEAIEYAVKKVKRNKERKYNIIQCIKE